jgi:hypothetical protein
VSGGGAGKEKGSFGFYGITRLLRPRGAPLAAHALDVAGRGGRRDGRRRRLRREQWSLLWWLFLQRFCYRQVMYYVMIKSVVVAVRGAAVGWGKLERKATVGAPLKSAAGARGNLKV